MAPSAPYPISGVVYETYLEDSGQTTPHADVSVRVMNVTTQEYTDWTTSNSSGQYTVDIANLASGYSDGDRIFVEAMIRTGEHCASMAYRLEVDTGVGSATQDIYLHCGGQPFNTCWITGFVNYNNSTVAGTISFYERETGILVLACQVGSNALGINPAWSHDIGIKANGGYFKTFSVKTLGNWTICR